MPYTQDEISPVYCMRCHKRAPGAELDHYKGMCFNCSEEIERIRVRQAHEAQVSMVAAEEAKLREKERIYNTSTGMGSCPQCQSKNITEFDRDAGGGDNGIQWGSATCSIIGCAGLVLLGIPILLCNLIVGAICIAVLLVGMLCLAPFLGTRAVKRTVRHCYACGHEWGI